MKSLFIAVLMTLFFSGKTTEPVTSDCKCKGIPLHGKVKVVESFEDFKVRVVNSFEDIRVDTNWYGQMGCGDWKFVTAGEDFTIRYVNAFEDFKIRYVNAFHGLPNR